MKDKDDDKPTPSALLHLARKLDATMRDADTHRAAMDEARAALDAATQAHAAAMATITQLHQEITTTMNNIVAAGGTPPPPATP